MTYGESIEVPVVAKSNTPIADTNEYWLHNELGDFTVSWSSVTDIQFSLENSV